MFSYSPYPPLAVCQFILSNKKNTLSRSCSMQHLEHFTCHFLPMTYAFLWLSIRWAPCEQLLEFAHEKKNVFEAFPFHIFLWGLDLCSPTKCLNSLCVVAGVGVSPAEWWNTDQEEEGHYNQSKNMMLSIDAIHPGNVGIKEALCVKGAVFFPVLGEAAVSVLSTRHLVCRISLVQKA